MIENSINGLVNYYLDKNYISECDRIYYVNRLIDILNLSKIDCSEFRQDLYTLLDELTNYAISKNLVDNNSYEIEYFQSNLTNLFVDKPSIINERILEFGLEYLYDLGVSTNYIKLRELEKNLKFSSHGVSITINIAKPEKSLEEIAMLKTIKSVSYPKCALCVENVGFRGDLLKPVRINHRVYHLKLNNRNWIFQYSPYLYFDYHCILIDEKHCDMVVDDETVKLQIEFVEKHPKYFIGNNAELPIIGGSILNHNHFQGGIYQFDIDKCNILEIYTQKSCKVEILDWYLSAIRIIGDKQSVIDLCNLYRKSWFEYENLEYKIINNEARHNSVNIITRCIDNKFSVIVIFRNNYADENYPSGLFHALPKYHHLKSENIGLIEAMGLAILPGRLVNDIELIKQKLMGEKVEINDIHHDWYEELCKINTDNLEELIEDSIASKFSEILKCCNVFKFTNKENMINEIKRIGGIK